jgi:pimeloyl-ACP methyl ester carboxylesterase
MARLFIALILFMFSSGNAMDQKAVVGSWYGSLSVQGVTLRIVFNITDSAGALTATMDSPDQGAFGIPMDSAIFRNDTLRIKSAAIMGEYVGKINEIGTVIDGTWSQGGMILELNLDKGEKAILNRPQEPKSPFPYLIEEVTVENEADKVTLAGTFTRPKKGEPFPAVLLITGSGPQDRDEAVFGHKPFWVMADYLTRRGIAVLRLDDRGIGQSTGDIQKATTEDFVRDALAAVEYLKGRDDVAANKIGLIGHSEGGIIAPIIAGAIDDIAFIVTLAGTALPGDEILITQAALIGRAEGQREEMVQGNNALQRLMFEIVKNEPNNDSAYVKLHRATEEWKNTLSEIDRAEIDALDDAYLDKEFRKVLSPWFRYFIAFDPYPSLTKVKCPVLAMIGEKDLQVPPDENLEMMERAFKEGGNSNYRLEKMEGLNHLFQHCTTGAVSEYGQIEETFAPEALQMIGDWIQEVIE